MIKRKEVIEMVEKKTSCGCGCVPLPPKKGKKSK